MRRTLSRFGPEVAARRRPRRSPLLLVLLLALLAAPAFAAPAAPAVSARGAPPAAATARAKVEEGATAILTEDHRLYLEAVPRRGEGLAAFTRRLCDRADRSALIVAANNGSTELKAGMRYRIPYEILAPEQQLKVARALFAQDGGQVDGWRHTVRGAGPLQRESLWHLAAWFTGDGANFRAIREYNELADDDVPRGTAVTIPAELLLPAFRGALPATEAPYQLAYGADATGEYAIYRLRPGEALYSSVVVRFTGRVFAADVNALASDIARLSGIRDVTDIPIGYRVKIPLDLLLPEYLPEGHPRRQEYEAELRASAKFSNDVRAQGLAGITVILDAGHGGRDVGASMAERLGEPLRLRHRGAGSSACWRPRPPPASTSPPATAPTGGSPGRTSSPSRAPTRC